jgi:hypothetical protein
MFKKAVHSLLRPVGRDLCLARGAYVRVREHDKVARTPLVDFFNIL